MSKFNSLVRKLIKRMPLREVELIQRALVFLANSPITSRFYNRLYYPVIRRKTSALNGFTAIDIETYNVCNLKCKMCPYPKMTREKVQMSMDLFKKIIDDVAQSNISQICLHLYSEPLLDTMLFERIKYVKSKGLWVEFASNGTILTQDKIDAIFDSGLDFINFSIDAATSGTYQKIRGADLEKTKNNIIQLKREREEGT